MWLVGSEKCFGDRFENMKLDDHYISRIPLRKFTSFNKKKARITPKMAELYPWYQLADSIKEEGFRIPVIAALIGEALYPVEGKHRVAAASLIEPYDPDFLIPCVLTAVDPIYTCKMYKKPHPDPFDETGFKKLIDR